MTTVTPDPIIESAYADALRHAGGARHAVGQDDGKPLSALAQAAWIRGRIERAASWSGVKFSGHDVKDS